MDNFDLKKYSVENKVTTNSRMMNEENTYSINLATIKELLKHSTVLKSHANAKGGPTIPEIESFIEKNHNSGKFLWWYSEPGEETGLQELSPEVALETAKAIETLSPVPEGVVSGFASSLHYVENPVDSKKLTSVTKYPTVTKVMKESEETPSTVAVEVLSQLDAFDLEDIEEVPDNVGESLLDYFREDPSFTVPDGMFTSALLDNIVTVGTAYKQGKVSKEQVVAKFREMLTDPANYTK